MNEDIGEIGLLSLALPGPEIGLFERGYREIGLLSLAPGALGQALNRPILGLVQEAKSCVSLVWEPSESGLF